jgi:hypothetical protein
MLFILIKKDTSIIHGSDTGGVQLADLAGPVIRNTSLRIIQPFFHPPSALILSSSSYNVVRG